MGHHQNENRHRPVNFYLKALQMQFFLQQQNRILPLGGNEDVHTWDKSVHLAQAYSHLSYSTFACEYLVYSMQYFCSKSSQLVGSCDEFF